MKNFTKYFSLTILICAFLSIYGWIVKSAFNNKQQFGILGDVIVLVSSYPDLLIEAFNTLDTPPETFLISDTNQININKLEFDVNVVVSNSTTDNKRQIKIINLKNNSEKLIMIDSTCKIHDRIMNPLFFSDSSICYSINERPILKKVDRHGNIIWCCDKIIPHHSLNFGPDSNIWACSYQLEKGDKYTFNGKLFFNKKEYWFQDNFVSLIDSENGDIIFHKSLAKLLSDNKLDYLILKSPNVDDPFHINDVQPVLSDSKYFNKGDVFISVRNLSCILLYRPKTNKVIKLIEGNFYAQHDIDIIDDSTIVIFNNNTFINKPVNNWDFDTSENISTLSVLNSNIIKFSFNTNSSSVLFDSIFKVNNIFTNTEGLLEFINDSTLICEEQNKGVLWVLQNENVLYKNVFKSEIPNYHHLLNWTRLIE